LIRPHLAPGGVVVSVQNGINEERIAAHVGWSRALGAIASLISVELVEPGCVRRTAPPGGERHTVFRVGEVHGRTTARAEELAALLRCVDSAKVTTNLWGERWSKLVVNSMRNAVSAVTGMTGNERDLDDTARWLGIRLGAEAVRVGQALGYELETMQRMEPETLARAGEGDPGARREIDEILVAYARVRADGQRPSTAQDILRGRRTEIDFINGYIAAKGATIGVAVPLQSAVTALVKKIERRELTPALALIAQL
jgi:2-dehydropantoate 2-reductase